MPEGVELVTGIDEHGQPANIGVGLDQFNRLTVYTPPASREVRLDPDSADEYQKILRRVNLSWRQS